MYNNIKIGDRIEITLIREKYIGKSYVSQVEEILGDNRLMIHVPISYGQLVKLAIGEMYAMVFFTEKGMIEFHAEVESFKKENEFHYMIVQLLNDGERIQRRDFFRYTCLLPLKFANIFEEETDEQVGKEELFDGIIKDLGGGGVRFVANAALEEGHKVKCFIMLGDKCLIVIGKVLHKQFFPKSNYKYQYRIEFVGMLPSDQEEIVQFIFNEQRRELQKVKG